MFVTALQSRVLAAMGDAPIVFAELKQRVGHSGHDVNFRCVMLRLRDKGLVEVTTSSQEFVRTKLGREVMSWHEALP